MLTGKPCKRRENVGLATLSLMGYQGVAYINIHKYS